MTQQQKQTLESALARAKAEGIHILGKGAYKGDGRPFWLVSSKQYATSNQGYIVALDGGHLVCNCGTRPSKNNPDGICKHRALVHEALLAEMEARKADTSLPKERVYDRAAPSMSVVIARAQAEQAERAAKREAALPVDAGVFSIWRS